MFELFGTPLYAPTLVSRSISAENPCGERGAGGKALNGRKGEPCHANLQRGQTYTFAEIAGPGAIRHMWLTFDKRTPSSLRNLVPDDVEDLGAAAGPQSASEQDKE